MMPRNSSIPSPRNASVIASNNAHESACFAPSRFLHIAMTKDEVDARKEGYVHIIKMKDEQTGKIFGKRGAEAHTLAFTTSNYSHILIKLQPTSVLSHKFNLKAVQQPTRAALVLNSALTMLWPAHLSSKS